MKYLNELNLEELRKVYENNNGLQEKVFDDMFDNAAFWCSEYLDCWKRGGIDYCIGWDRGTYFKATNNEYFLDGLKKAQENYCFLSDSYNSTIKYVENLISRMENLDYNTTNYDINCERLETRIEELIEELETACYKRFILEYEDCFNDEYQLDYFLSFYSSERMNDDFYINDNYELFEHVEFERSFA